MALVYMGDVLAIRYKPGPAYTLVSRSSGQLGSLEMLSKPAEYGHSEGDSVQPPTAAQLNGPEGRRPYFPESPDGSLFPSPRCNGMDYDSR